VFKKHPAGLPVLFFTEMWERFAYYLMIGIFFLYMTDSVAGGMGFTESRGHEYYGWFIALVYLTPFLGGILADRFLGYKWAVVLGGLMMAVGYLLLGATWVVQDGLRMPLFWLSLGVVILGNGFFKPNISSVVGKLYEDGSPLKDTGYNIFYMGINIGAFVCNFVAAILRNRFGWGWAFAAAGIGMVIGVVWFLFGQKKLGKAAEREGAGTAVGSGDLAKVIALLGVAVVSGVLGYFFSKTLDLESMASFFSPGNTAFLFAVIPLIVYYIGLWATAKRDEKGPIAALLAIFGVVIVFWMIFHQNGNTLTQWARDHTDREVSGTTAKVLDFFYMDQTAPDPWDVEGVTSPDGDEQLSYWWNVPESEWPAPGQKVTLLSTELFQSVNPFFIIVLTPVVVGFFTWMRGRGKEPSTPGKIAWGLVITALSTLVMVMAVTVTHGGTVKGSMWWLIGTYFVITIGELCLSPMGLSLVSKLSPARLTGLMMGGWFLSTSIGNKMSGVVGGLWERVPSLSWIFWINCIAALVSAAAIALMVPWIRRVMAEHDERVNNNNRS
jgi:POT family proton-dependent oligopeptide transporter